MSKLLSANFTRLIKAKVFWLGTAFMLGMGAFIPFLYHIQNKTEHSDMILDNGIFSYVMFIGIITAVIISLFIGTEYSDGAIRNKIVIGHSRTSIYLSNLITVSAAGIAVIAAFLIPYISIGAPLLGWFKTDIKYIIYFTLSALALTIAFAAVFTLIAMLCQNKAASAVASLLLALVLLFVGQYVYSRLQEPRQYDGMVYMNTDTGETVTEEAVLNPRYLEGTKREVYEALADIIPGGQQIQISYMAADPIWPPAIYSGAIFVLTTAAGVYLFRKKDLK